MFIRRTKTASGATAVQVVRKQYGEIVEIHHIGSAHGKRELNKLEKQAKEVLQEKLHPDQPGLFDKPLKTTPRNRS